MRDVARRRQSTEARCFPPTRPRTRSDTFGTLSRDFFQRDRDGNPKGIIVIDLEDFQ